MRPSHQWAPAARLPGPRTKSGATTISEYKFELRLAPWVDQLVNARLLVGSQHCPGPGLCSGSQQQAWEWHPRRR